MFTVRANRVRIYSEFTRNRGNKGTDDLYAVTFHELGHQSHWKLNRWNTTFSKKIVRESWADFVEHTFIQEYYPNYPSDKQNENRNSMRDGYSAIFIDLVDNDNQRFTRGHGGSIIYPDDDVRGYTLEQLQNALEYARKLEHVRDYLTRHYNNNTDQHLDKLFDFYIDIQ